MLQFAVFDHVDHNGTSLGEQLEGRLRLIGVLEAEGYYAYHVAEHHSTARNGAVSERVSRCGGALLEHQRYGIDPATAQAMYHEAFAVLMQACETEVLNFEGRFYQFKDYVTVAKPVQRPHPPLWYGAPNADAVPWAATRGINVISLGLASRARDISSRYRDEWAAAGRDSGNLPMIGISRHIGLRKQTDRRDASRTRPIGRDASRWNFFFKDRLSIFRSRRLTRGVLTSSPRSVMASPVRPRRCFTTLRNSRAKPE
jgi:alkanesulfonate monooxygenase SsuD/methylene tetrahydromethanopterin reductase-like flavin-dependent oxidoreductase (luciferase family)